MDREITEEYLIIRGIPKTWACVGCGVNTAPGCQNAAQLLQGFKALTLNPTATRYKIDKTSEVYCVKPKVWKDAGMDDFGGCLCIGCLEKKLGRRLVPKDFDRKHPFANVPGTPRLLERRDG
jgi:hypothetical protein